MKYVVTTALVAALIASTGCSTWRKLDNKERGAVIGGGSGALIGNAISPGAGGTILGGAAGAVAGGVVGNEMDKSERD